MVVVSHHVPVPPERVFAVLADGWSYASWVVGAAHIRQVDGHWPAVGSRIHHSVGPWPVHVQDVSTVVAVEPGSVLELDARMWPVGGARIRLTLHADAGGTRIEMAEKLTRGPLRLLPKALQTPLLAPRNVEALKRLADIAVNR